MKIFALAAILVATSVAPAAQAQNASPYGCACLHNNTKGSVNFRYKWGEGQWVTDYLRSGYQETLCWKYAAGSTTSPNLTFQLDVDMSDVTAWTTFSLPRVQSATNKCDAVANKFHYDISYRPNTNNAFIQVTHRQ